MKRTQRSPKSKKRDIVIHANRPNGKLDKNGEYEDTHHHDNEEKKYKKNIK